MNTDGYVIHAYHIFMMLGGIAGIFALITRTWIKPIKDWRSGIEKQIKDNKDEIEKQHTELKHDYELFRQKVEGDLERGNQRFDDLNREIQNLTSVITELKEEMISFRTAFQGAVFQGVGNERRE